MENTPCFGESFSTFQEVIRKNNVHQFGPSCAYNLEVSNQPFPTSFQNAPAKNHRKTIGNHRLAMGKQWENDRKTIGKPLENHWKTIEKWWFHGIFFSKSDLFQITAFPNQPPRIPPPFKFARAFHGDDPLDQGLVGWGPSGLAASGPPGMSG